MVKYLILHNVLNLLHHEEPGKPQTADPAAGPICPNAYLKMLKFSKLGKRPSQQNATALQHISARQSGPDSAPLQGSSSAGFTEHQSWRSQTATTALESAPPLAKLVQPCFSPFRNADSHTWPKPVNKSPTAPQTPGKKLSGSVRASPGRQRESLPWF